MKKLTLVVGFLIIFGCSAIAAHAQTSADALVRIDDPTCTPGPGCIVLTYTGPTTTVADFPSYPPFSLLVANPPSYYLDPPPPSDYNCGSDVFTTSSPIVYSATPPPTPPPAYFFGCNFWGGTITSGETYSISIAGSDIPILISLDNDGTPVWECAATDASSCSGDMATVDPTPEPSTSLLYMSGLLLFLLVGFFRKRFRAASNVVAAIGVSPRASLESIA